MHKIFRTFLKPFGSKRHGKRNPRHDSSFARALQQEELKYVHNGFAHPPSLGESSTLYKVVSQRLSRVSSLSIQPRVNPDIEGLPSREDVINSDRQRLLLRLEEYDLMEKSMNGDGACQFRSLSDQLYGDPKHHDAVREMVVQQLQQHPERYSMYVPSGYAEYCKAMASTSTWGDHVTLQAAADAYGLRIMVLTSYQDNCVIKIDPVQQSSDRVLWLSFWAEVHYNSIYPKEEPPTAG